MSKLVIMRPGWMPDFIIRELVNVELDPCNNFRYIVEEGQVDEKKLTLTGIHVYPLISTGKLENILDENIPSQISGWQNVKKELKVPIKKESKSSRARLSRNTLLIEPNRFYIIGPSRNGFNIDRIKLYKDPSAASYYGKIHFMNTMLYFHSDHFKGKPTQLLDPFLGRGSTLIAGLQQGIPDIVGIEIDKQDYNHAQKNLMRFLDSTLREWEYFKIGYDEELNLPLTFFEIIGDKWDAPANITIYKGDSPRVTKDIVTKMEMDDFDIISDIPRGCQKALIDGEAESIPIGQFHDSLVGMIKNLPTHRISMAVGKKDNLDLTPVKIIGNGECLYDIVMYENR